MIAPARPNSPTLSTPILTPAICPTSIGCATMALDVKRGVDAHQGVDERRDGDAQGDRRRVIHALVVCASGFAKRYL
jgi:hypothetical protein